MNCTKLLSSFPLNSIESEEIYALLVSTLTGLDRALTLGYCFTRATAYFVLLVQRERDNVYKRVGMGCVFGQEIEKGFQTSLHRDVVLV